MYVALDLRCAGLPSTSMLLVTTSTNRGRVVLQCCLFQCQAGILQIPYIEKGDQLRLD